MGEERVGRLLTVWQESDGVDKALAQRAEEERRDALMATDGASLLRLCNRTGVDPFVKEVMVDRVIRKENAAGLYLRPGHDQKEESSTSSKSDMVDALLANEVKRKKTKAQEMGLEEKIANKRKELKALSVDDLKAALEEKGMEPCGKKDDMIETLSTEFRREQEVALRKAELKAMGTEDLKTIVTKKGLAGGSGKDAMVKAILAHEAKCRADLDVFNTKAAGVLAKKKLELDAKSASTLKDMCVSKALAVGGGKEQLVQRLLEEAQESGEVDKAVSIIIKESRKEELMILDKTSVLGLCEATGADPLVKDIIVERIIARESEGDNTEEPPAKKARKSRK